MATENDELKDALKEAESTFKTAGESALDKLKAVGVDLAGDGATGVFGQVVGALGNPTPIPLALGENPDFKTAAQALISQAVLLYKHQAAEAITHLSKIGAEAAEKGTDILARMAGLGQKVAEGNLPVAIADRAMDNYLEALKLVGMAAENATKVEAMKRAQAALATAKSLLVTGLQVALQIGQRLAMAYLGALV